MPATKTRKTAAPKTSSPKRTSTRKARTKQQVPTITPESLETLKVVYEVKKNRATGARVVVIDNRDGSVQALPEGDDKVARRAMFWVTYNCDTGNFAFFPRRVEDAEAQAHHPENWDPQAKKQVESKEA